MSIISFRKTDFLPSSNTDAVPGARRIVIAVDGPAASGKGTLAKRLADRLGYAYLDTGALYRAVAMATLEIGGDPAQWTDVEPAINIIKRNLTPELLSNPLLRTPEVSEGASKVAALPQVRQALLEYQRAFAVNPPGYVGGAVLDGRDIGSVVCPDADIKFFITASVDERARRRFIELQQGFETTSFETVLEDIKRRDQRDQTRSIAPTLAADDAYILDTTGLTPAETLEEAIGVIRAQFLAETAETAGTAGSSSGGGSGGAAATKAEKMAV
ncbi:MAG: (d)CMP kinase [Alphaproteobacteria bacterium]|nr:(d)CMP kinase [Alphaproteobacteria bacterium]